MNGSVECFAGRSASIRISSPPVSFKYLSESEGAQADPSPLCVAAAAGAHLPLSSEPSLAEASSSADSDSPLIVHSPGQILRRTARTKIRKAGLVGDGGGHRFGPSRRVRSASSDLGGAVDGDDESIGGNTSVDSLESGEALQVASEIVDGDPGGRSLSSSPSSDNQHEVQYFEDAPAIDMDDFPPTAIDGAWLDQPVGAQPPSSVNLDAPLPPKPSSDASPARPPLHSPPSLAPPASAPSPASADYDWSTHHQPSPQQQQLPPSQPYVPPPPLPASAPLPERKESIPPSAPTTSSAASRASSFSSEGGKKKSGWARLGLGVKGAAEDKDKKKGKKGEKEMEKVMEATSRQQQLDREKEAREVRDREEKERKERERELSSKEKEGAGGSSFFGGLFGKRKSEQEPVAPPTPSPPPEVRTPPPPPTASGALAPNGRYINFYRLPIHVERAVYRLSHIKLANPRRPLYEQVLISNLMYASLSSLSFPEYVADPPFLSSRFWYLSIINKPAAPPPPAPTPIPVPVPQMRGEEPHQQQHQAQPHQERQSERTSSNQKRAGLSKPAAEGSRRSGNRSAEMPVRQPQFGEQNRQIEQEYSDGRDHQQQHSSPQPSSAPRQHQHHHQSHPPLQPHQHHQQQSPIPHVVVAPSPPTTADFASSSQHSTSRSPERASAPANMYRVASTSSDSLSSTDDGNQDDDDDDRPLGSMPTHRESYPPNRPIPVTSYPKHEAGFQVTSRRVSPTPPASSSSAVSAEENQRRRVSSVSAISAVSSTGSFDASEIIDAYSSGGGGGAGTSPATSPVLSFKEGMVGAGELGVGGAVGRAGVAEVTHAPLFGNVAPRRRGDSLVNRGEAKGADELARVRSRSPPLVGAGGAGGEFR